MYRPNNLKVLFGNARGFSSKLVKLKKYLYVMLPYVNEIDVVCACETFLKSDSNTTNQGLQVSHNVQ